MSSIRGNCICVMNVKRSVCSNGYPIPFLTYNTSRRFLDIQRVASCSILDTDIMIWTRQRSFRWPVICHASSSGICNYAYDLCKSSSMTLFNALYLISTLRLNHYNDKKYQSFLISSGHNFHDISSLLSFTGQMHYHQSWGIDNFTSQLSSYPFFLQYTESFDTICMYFLQENRFLR